MRQRFSILVVGLALGAAFALGVASSVSTTTAIPLVNRVWVWLFIMGGPITGMSWGITQFRPLIHVGWLGMLLIAAHPISPGVATAIATFFGFALWFFAGYYSVMIAAAGP